MEDTCGEEGAWRKKVGGCVWAISKKGGRVCVSNFECSLKDIASFRRIEDVRLLGSNYTTIALRQQSKKGGGEI